MRVLRLQGYQAEVWMAGGGGTWTRRQVLRRGAGLVAAGSGAMPLWARGAGLDLPKPKDLGGSTGGAGGLATSGAGSLKAHAELKGLLVGCAVNVGLLEKEPGYGRALAEQFDMVVGENCMKWGQIHPGRTRYDFQQADALVGFAEQNGIKVRGHNLLWHENLPDWFATEVNRGNAREVLEEHIATVAGRYKGRIHSWDVVNEAIWPKDGRPDGMRAMPWLELLGPEYVEMAFRAARAADPGAILTYNDYGFEYDTPEEMLKRGFVLGLVDRLQKAGAPIGAVGIQSHLRTGDITKLGDGIRDFAKRMGKQRLEVFVTETDVNDDGLEGGDVAEQDRDVATVYRHYLEEMLKERSVKAVLVWGLADEQSWLEGEKWRVKHPARAERPLLLTETAGAYGAKPAFYAVRGAIDGAKKR